tara:strand:+ start:32 stop:358 length:327 start_codon:yes stop_codon:yes gene_type:complete
MEDIKVATESVSAETTPTPTPTPSAEPTTEMAVGGATDSTPKLGWVAIMMLGLTSASLIYSIFYYRRRLDALKKGDNKMIGQLQSDMQEMKNKIDTLTGNRTRNGRLV